MEYNNELTIDVKILTPGAAVPVYAHDGDAGCDLKSSESLTIGPGERAVVPTGLAMAIPEGYGGFVQPRSGLAAKHGVSVVNTPGLIDSGYRGEIKVILINTDKENVFTIERGDKIAQLVIQKVEKASFRAVDELSETVRGEGGFGSTGHR